MKLSSIFPATIEGQLIGLLAASFGALLALLAILEVVEQDSVAEWATNEYSIMRLSRLVRVLPFLQEGAIDEYVASASKCHEGYSISGNELQGGRSTPETDKIEAHIASALGVPHSDIRTRYAVLTRRDFSYGECGEGEIGFPVNGIIISMRITDGRWLNAEVHPHEWHLTPTMTNWLIRSGAAFLLVGGVALILIRRIGKPLSALAAAARSFGKELQVAEISESGPPDVRRMIQAFNDMQFKVSGEMKRRTQTLAAISHDIRSPLTALRLKAELVTDEAVRKDFLFSVAKMERITATALEYLKGDFREEEKKCVNLCFLVESVCSEFSDSGEDVAFICQDKVEVYCRSDAICRAIHNLVENAVKYAGAAKVSVAHHGNDAVIRILDTGPGIAADQISKALSPFERLSQARESGKGGFGLGLAIVKMIVEGHDGRFILSKNDPTGVVAVIILPGGA